jgi:nitrogen regulatory protein PII 2
MKEVVAIIRRAKVPETRKALESIGVTGMTLHAVLGRGKQAGIMSEIDPEILGMEGPAKLKMTPTKYALEHPIQRPLQFIPKRMIEIVIPDDQLEVVVQTIISVNKTGNVGDGRVFVLPLEEAYRVRTGQKEESS